MITPDVIQVLIRQGATLPPRITLPVVYDRWPYMLPKPGLSASCQSCIDARSTNGSETAGRPLDRLDAGSAGRFDRQPVGHSHLYCWRRHTTITLDWPCHICMSWNFDTLRSVPPKLIATLDCRGRHPLLWSYCNSRDWRSMVAFTHLVFVHDSMKSLLR